MSTVRTPVDDRPEYVLTFTCADRVGIVAAVTGALAAQGGFILDSQQYADLDTGRLLMRVSSRDGGAAFPSEPRAVRAFIAEVADANELDWSLSNSAQTPAHAYRGVERVALPERPASSLADWWVGGRYRGRRLEPRHDASAH